MPKLNYDKLYDACNTGKIFSNQDKLILTACGIIRWRLENRDIKELMMFTYSFLTTQRNNKDEMSIWYNKSCKSTKTGPILLKDLIRHPFTRKKCKNPVDLEKIIKDANSWEEEWVL